MTALRCSRCARNGVTAAADGPGGLCASCRDRTAPGNPYRGLGSGPVIPEPPPRPDLSEASRAARQARFEAKVTRYLAARRDGKSPREAAEVIGVQVKSALRRYEPLFRAHESGSEGGGAG